MTYKLDPKSMYMMPIHFGPMCGPRQGPGGKKFAFSTDKRKITNFSVSFFDQRVSTTKTPSAKI